MLFFLVGCRLYSRLIAGGLWGEAAVLLLTMLQPEQQASARDQPFIEQQEAVGFARRLGIVAAVAATKFYAMYVRAGALLDRAMLDAAAGAGSPAAGEHVRTLAAGTVQEGVRVYKEAASELIDYLGGMPALSGDQQMNSWSAAQVIQVLGDRRLAHLLQAAAAAALQLKQQVCAWEAAGGVPQPQAAQTQAGGRFGDWLAPPWPAEQLLLRAAAAQATRACANLACINASGASEASQKRGRRCAGCALLRYCSAACQQADWQGHRATCRLLVRRKAAGL